MPSKPWSTIISGSGGSIDTVPPKTLNFNQELNLSGWAYDPRKKIPVSSVVIYDNQRLLPVVVQVNMARPDVAKAFNNANLANAGWTVNLNANILGKGSHVLSFYVVLGSNKFAQLYSSKAQGSFPIKVTD